MTIPAGVALVALSLVAGWAALAPVRRSLGPLWYHLVAYPVGLLGWAFVLSVAGVLGRPYDALVMGVGLIAFFVAAAGIARSAGSSGVLRVPWWTFAAAFAVAMGAAFAAWAFRASFSTDDSIMAYELLGMWLRDTGSFTVRLASERSFLVPAIHAANRTLGGDWGYVQYPVLGLNVVLIVTAAVWDAGSRLRPRLRGVTAVGTGALLGTAPAFAFHSFYVHSHMVSAVFLLTAVVALWKATRDDLRARCLDRGWLCVAGFASAGLAITRTDGLAYVFVVLAILASITFSSGMSRRDLAGYFAPMFGVLGVPYLVAFGRLGIWSSGKLDGRISAALILLMLVFALALVYLAGSAALRRILGRRSGLIAAVLAADVLVVIALTVVKTDSFVRALTNMVGNLARFGGYQSLWYVALLVGVASLVHSRGTLSREWTGHVLFVLVQFMAVAVVVHVTKHPGRLSPNDSFSRVAFHSVPILFLFTGMWAATVIERLQGAGESRARNRIEEGGAA